MLSAVIPQRDGGGDNGCSVKVSIEISESQEPVTFTCDCKDNNTIHLLALLNPINVLNIPRFFRNPDRRVPGNQEGKQNPPNGISGKPENFAVQEILQPY